MNSKANILKIKVELQEDCIKLGEYLRYNIEFSSRFIKKSARGGRIKVNNEKVTLSYELKNNDIIEIQLDKDEEQNIIPEKMDLNIVYEDEDIVVINKPKGMVVHPTKTHLNGTLSNGLLYYFKEKNEKSIVRLVNRLDMDTTGLVLVAKNAFSHMILARDMQKNKFQKSYLAVVHGNMKEKCGTIDKPIYRVGEGTIKRIIDERGQKSVTNFEVIERYNQADLVKLTLETGRTHQIRVHLSSIGHPIFGDVLYGKEESEFIDRQALHAFRLEFPHPTKRKIIKLESELPSDMNELILKLNSK